MTSCHDHRHIYTATRRRFCAAVPAATLALAVQRTGPAQAQAFSTAAVDIHHHYLPPWYKPLNAAWLRRLATGSDQPDAWSPENSIRAMDAARVERALLSLSAPGTSFEGAPRSPADMARACNDFAEEVVRGHPDRFDFLGALPLPDVASAIAEAERVLARGAKGVGLMTNYAGRYLGDPAFAPLFARLDAIGTIVYVHPTAAPCCVGLTPGISAPLMEFPIDTGRSIASLLWSGVLSRSPHVRFVFSHGGGVLPMLLERVGAVARMDPERAAQVPEGAAAALARIHVDTATVTGAPQIAALQAWLPPERILYGTDYPWGNPAAARTALHGLELAPERLAAIERGNALALLEPLQPRRAA